MICPAAALVRVPVFRVSVLERIRQMVDKKRSDVVHAALAALLFGAGAVAVPASVKLLAPQEAIAEESCGDCATTCTCSCVTQGSDVVCCWI